jgi:hypothetical protein
LSAARRIHLHEAPVPATWRATVPHDLDWLPQMSEELLQRRFLQKRGVLRWPATTLCFGATVAAIVGIAPNENGGVDIWSEFSPFADLARIRVARACRERLALFRRAVGSRPVFMEVQLGDARAARFARFLGFAPTDQARFCRVLNVWVEKYQWHF